MSYFSFLGCKLLDPCLFLNSIAITSFHRSYKGCMINGTEDNRPFCEEVQQLAYDEYCDDIAMVRHPTCYGSVTFMGCTFIGRFNETACSKINALISDIKTRTDQNKLEYINDISS